MSTKLYASVVEPEAGPSRAFDECFRPSEGDSATSKASTDIDIELELAPTSTSPSTSSSLKRSRDAADTSPYSDSDSNSLSDSSSPDVESPPSPSKRPKLQTKDDETPASTPAPVLVRTPRKEVRFHPDTVDNSLWADLNDGKYSSERPSTPHRVHSPSPDKMNVIETFTSEPSSSSATSRPLTIAPSPVPTDMSLDVEAEPYRSMPFRSRRQQSRNRAKSFLARNSWINDFDFDADTMNGDPRDAEDDTSSVCTNVGDSPRLDLDNVSAPRSSPPPSVRIMAMNLSASEANREQAAIDAKRKRDANVKIPSIYFRPSSSTSWTLGGDSKSSRPRHLTQEEIARYGQILMTALSKLPAEEANASREAFSIVSQYHGQCRFEAGYREGLRTQQTAANTQAPEKSST